MSFPYVFFPLCLLFTLFRSLTHINTIELYNVYLPFAHFFTNFHRFLTFIQKICLNFVYFPGFDLFSLKTFSQLKILLDRILDFSCRGGM